MKDEGVRDASAVPKTAKLCLNRFIKYLLTLSKITTYVASVACARVKAPPVIKARFSFFSTVYQMFHLHMNKTKIIPGIHHDIMHLFFPNI